MDEKTPTIIDLIKRGSSILDLGCVGHVFDISNRDNFLHGILCNKFNNVTGVDYLPDMVLKMNEAGYNVICQNVETMSIGTKYDTIVAGDIIEHVSNPGIMLEKIINHLDENGEIIISTPNAYNLFSFLLLLKNQYVSVNNEHTVNFCPKTIRELFRRYNLHITDEKFVCLYPNTTSLVRAYIHMIPFLRKIFKQNVIANVLVYRLELRK